MQDLPGQQRHGCFGARRNRRFGSIQRDGQPFFVHPADHPGKARPGDGDKTVTAVRFDKAKDLIFREIVIDIKVEVPSDQQATVGGAVIPGPEGGAGHQVHILDGVADIVRRMVVQHARIGRPDEVVLRGSRSGNPENLFPVFRLHVAVEVPVEKPDKGQHETLVEYSWEELGQLFGEGFFLPGHQLFCKQAVR